MHRCRAGVDVDDVVFPDFGSGQAGDNLLGILILRRAAVEWFRCGGIERIFVQDDAAVDFVDEALLLELADVAADRVFGYIEAAAEVFDGKCVLLEEQLADLLDAIDLHENHLLGRKQGSCFLMTLEIL